MTATASAVLDVQGLHCATTASVVESTVLRRPGVTTVEANALNDTAMRLRCTSLPVSKAPGDAVIGASINTTGTLRVRATKVGSDTALAQGPRPAAGRPGRILALHKMRQNLWWAVGYNVIALPIGALSMSGSSPIVAVNALILKRLRLAAPPAAARDAAEPRPGR